MEGHCTGVKLTGVNIVTHKQRGIDKFKPMLKVSFFLVLAGRDPEQCLFSCRGELHFP